MTFSKDSKIYVAGHNGMVGSAIWRELKRSGYTNLIGKSRSELELTNDKAVLDFISAIQPEIVFIAAAKVGGIMSNHTNPVAFLSKNLRIELNLIDACAFYKVKKLIFLGSTCVYPRDCPQPITEDMLLTGPLEETNQWYALAKIVGIKLCQAWRLCLSCNFISVMPCNLYGPNDNYNPNTSHVLPGMIRKFYEAKINNTEKVTLWGTGKPLREFLYVDDLARALVLLMNNYNDPMPINVGSGMEITIKELALMVASEMGYNGEIEWDITKPDGTPRKICDSSKINKMGWTPEISLKNGISLTHQDFLTRSINSIRFDH